ncbi:type 1 phosphatases regulator Ypi1p [Monosporozyma unispora]|nr:Type 1 phosphatases regulator ypi1 [Kazachstania unispora]
MSYGNEDMEGSQTICIQESAPVLTLRATNDKKSQERQDKEKEQNNVRWKQDVVDNEHMNKKKTKICCIYHPQNSDEELEGETEPEMHYHDHRDDSSDSGSDSDSDNDAGLSRDERRQRRIKRRHEKLNGADYKTNAYEFQPKYPNKSTLKAEGKC